MTSKSNSKKGPESDPLPIPVHQLPEGAREALAIAQSAFAREPEGLPEDMEALVERDCKGALRLADALSSLASKLHPPVTDHGRRDDADAGGLKEDRRAVLDTALGLAEHVCLLPEGPVRSTVEWIVKQAQRYGESLREDAPPRADWLVVLGLGLFRRCRSLSDRLRVAVAQRPPRSDAAPLSDGTVSRDAVARIAPAKDFPNIFACEGSIWTIRFQGVTRPVAERAGLRRIQMLLERPGESISVEKLLGRPVSPEPDRVQDLMARRATGDQIERLVEAVEGETDPERRAELQDELERLQRFASTAQRLGGRSRRLGDPRKTAAGAAGKSMRDAIDAISEAGLTSLAFHLRDSIQGMYSVSPVYSPSSPIQWLLLLQK